MKNTPIYSAGRLVDSWYMASITVNKESATLQPIIPIAKQDLLVYKSPNKPDILRTKQPNSAKLVERNRSHEVGNSGHSNVKCNKKDRSRTIYF
jgi:hypothetical protein